mmetsp:Transcript_19695/g.51374  ORF Transcript_19695/g.51374 Transcript_19695/m.51374 type:complete len:451 (+) Transcript_19695:175-1527(+)
MAYPTDGLLRRCPAMTLLLVAGPVLLLSCLAAARDAQGGRCDFRASAPKQYIAHRTLAAPAIDGNLDEPLWREVEWTDPFVDISDRPKPRYVTKIKMRWDDAWLYVGALLEEPQVWANVSEHNQVIFQDNDFEIFVDADGSNHFYKEFEMNARGATWDLCLNKPYIDGGHENSTRVFGGAGWEMQPPLVSATALRGAACELNKPGAACRGWTAEVALPLDSLRFNTSAGPPVADADFWRINFSRVQWHVVAAPSSGADARCCGNPSGRASPQCQCHYEKDPSYAATDPDNWVWSPQGAVDMHLPERWGVLQFAGVQVDRAAPAPYPHWSLRHIAMSLYDAQRAYAASSRGGVYTADVDALRPLAPPYTLDGSCSGPVRIALTGDARTYTGEVPSRKGGVVACVSSDRLLRIRRAGQCLSGTNNPLLSKHSSAMHSPAHEDGAILRPAGVQ